jgi:hypothetical protein
VAASWLQGVIFSTCLMACVSAVAPAAPDVVPRESRVELAPPSVPAGVFAVVPAVAIELPLRVSVMRRGYFEAYSVAGNPGLGGHSTSDNLPRSLAATDAPAVSGVALAALPDERRGYQVGTTVYDGYRVVLANASQAPLEIAASDSRLPIVQEALDVDGNWRPIEYLPSSFCGNSWHTLILQPGEYWDFTAPRYGGGLATELRFRMTLDDGTELHSQPVGGSIDPRQFTDKEGHRPTNIMDPYWE